MHVHARAAWHRAALQCLRDVDVVFADPDNGIRMSGRTAAADKFALLSELADYAERRQSLVVYRHADRSADASTRAERRLSELAEAVGQSPVGAITARRGTCRSVSSPPMSAVEVCGGTDSERFAIAGAVMSIS